MKKYLSYMIMVLMLLIPFCVKADVINLDNYEQMNLIDTLKSEEMDLQFSGYEESNDQVTIYMFRGNGCEICRGFLEYLNSITSEYGHLFKLRSFEIWNDSNNAALLDKMGDVTGSSSDGIPYIIIGETIFKGYTEEWQPSILEAIKTEAAKKKKFDYFEEYNKKEKKALYGEVNVITIAVIIICNIISVLVVIYYQNKNKKELMRYINKKLKKVDDKDNNDK